MKKALIVVGGVLLLFIVVFVVIGLMLSNHVSTSRTVNIQADTARIHALCSDLTRWPEWTPWQDADPTVVTTLGPITSGVGASQKWRGKEGDGELTLTKSEPNQGIAYDMFFINGEKRTPMKSTMTYAPNGATTNVTWTLEGNMDVPVLGGYIVMMMGGAIDEMFDSGLAKLKAKAEAQ